MAWPDSTDPAYVKAYRHAYYLKNKEKDNRGRARRYREARKRQREYLIKNGLYPVIPVERRYEIPPNLRELVYAKLIKYGPRPKQSRHRSQKETVLHGDRGSERTGTKQGRHRTGTGDTGQGT